MSLPVRREPGARAEKGDRASALAAGALFIASALIHAILWYPYRADPFFSTLVSDAQSYHAWALRILERGLAAEPVFHQPPLFPLLVAAVYRPALALDAAQRMLVIQMLLDSLAIALIVPIGRLYLRSAAAGLAGGIVALLHAPVVFYGLKLLPIPLALATQALALLLLALARRRGRVGLDLLAGAACGLACLARTEMVLFLPVAAGALWRGRANEPLARRVGAVLLLLIGTGLVVAPATLHNLRRGDRVLISSAAGENLFIGNQAGADGGHTPLHPQAGDLFSQRALAQRIAEQAAGRELRPSEVSAYWRGRAVQQILADPADWLVLESRKLRRVLDPGDPADMYSLLLERRHYLGALYALPLSSWGVWLLGLIGASLALRRCPQAAWPLVALVIVHLFVLLAFFASARLRVPLLFFLAPLAGLAIMEGVGRLRSGRGRPLVLGVIALLLISSIHWLFVARASTQEVIRLASVLSRESRLEEALALLDPWIAEPEPDPLALDHAGWVRSKQGDLDTAREHYLRALEIGMPAPREAQTRSRLASLYERTGALEQAAVQHDLAVAVAPSSAGAHQERAMFRLRRGQTAAAIEDLRRAADLAPGWEEPLSVLRSLGVVQVNPRRRP